MTISIVQTISNETSISFSQVNSVISLLNEGSTIPFIARYRKEMTGNLDEVEIKTIYDRNIYLTELQERKQVIQESIENQGKLTPKLKNELENCLQKNILEDLYAPYKPKRRTRATIAKEKGLEPLAELIFEQNITSGNINEYTCKFISEDLGVESEEDVLNGAKDIIAEQISEIAELKDRIRSIFQTEGKFNSKVLKKSEKTKSKYENYYLFSESVTTIPSHRVLAMRRGEKEHFLSLTVSAPHEKIIKLMNEFIIKNENSIFTQYLTETIEDSYSRLIKPSLDTEIRVELKDRAETEAIKVFSKNLRELLLSAPLGNHHIMAVDPGIRTGSKIVILSKTGDYKENDVIYTNNQSGIEKAEQLIISLIKKYDIKYIAVGNGTGGREIKLLIDKWLKKHSISECVSIIVNESGASVYSASEIAREEFPKLDLTVRGAISIGRRLQDPLAELVKIEPKSIGVGQYQHDVNQKHLQKELTHVVESCVNYVGVDLNTASHSLLEYVSGISKNISKNIIEYRSNQGTFTNRKELLKVKGLGPKAFEQSAGFLRIRNGKNPLDNTSVHPESYYIVKKICTKMNVSVPELLQDSTCIDSIDINDYINDKIGLYTLEDIVNELKKPGRDPRESFKNPEFDDNINSIDDLEDGMKLNGVITNITNFGAFCDIGVHQDGLIHISEISHNFIKSPNEILKLGQHVNVVVLGIEKERNRITLSIKKLKSPPKKKSRTRYNKPKKKTKITMDKNNPFKKLESLL